MQRILVIDDNQQVRATMLLTLQAKGFQVVAVDNGEAGIKTFDESKFDLAIVDIFMPGLDGTKVIQTLQQRAPNLPIIAISGVPLRVAGRGDIISVVPELSNVVSLQKPFRPADLFNAIQQAMGAQSAA